MPTTSWLRLLVGLLVAALTVVACDRAMGLYLDRHGTNLGYRYIAHKWRVLGSLDEPVDWVVLGDSSGSQAFDPEVLREQAGLSAINLGTIGNFGLTDDLWMLEEYLDRFGPPKKVILIHVYDVWRRRLDARLLSRVPRARAMDPSTVEKYDIDEEQLHKMWLMRYARMYAERTSIRKTIELTWHRLTKTQEEMDELRRTDRSLPEKEPELTDTGFVRMCGEIPREVKNDARGHMRFLRKARPRVSRDNREALEAIAELGAEHQFEVVIINGPIYERMLLKDEFNRYFRGLVAHLRRLTSDHSHVRVVDELFGAPTKHLQNIDHITCDATADYTRWVVSQVEDSR